MDSQELPTIDALLRLLPMPTTSNNKSGPQVILHTVLPSHPALASVADENGYNLLHACASYASGYLNESYELLRALVREYQVDVNGADLDGDTPLFYAERLETVRILVEELGADWQMKNEEELTAEENARKNAHEEESSVAEGWNAVAEYLKSLGQNGLAENFTNSNQLQHPPPPLPPGISMDLGAVTSEESLEGQETPDPEFRARIEALAARSDFRGEQGQAELRQLVEEALGGLSSNQDNNTDNKRGRIS